MGLGEGGRGVQGVVCGIGGGGLCVVRKRGVLCVWGVGWILC